MIWKSIDSAPKDGQAILSWIRHGYPLVVRWDKRGYWYSEGLDWDDGDIMGWQEIAPLEWEARVNA